MRKSSLIAVCVGLCLGLCSLTWLEGCRPSSGPSGGQPSAPPLTSGMTKVELHQEWFPFAGYAGEVMAVQNFARDQSLDLAIVPGSESVDPIKVVLSGSADFAVVGGDLLISAVAKGAPLVAIGVINHESPTCFVVKKDSGIAKPQDFVGKKVGVLPGTNTERIYQILMKRAGVDRSKITEFEVPFDLQTFVLGQYDVRPAFIYDEPVSLKKQGIEYSIISPAEHGVQMIGTVYFTRRDVLEKKPEVVKKLVQSLVNGWKYALEHPNEAVQALSKSYPDIDAERELESLKLGKRYFEGHAGQPLTSTKAQWEQSIRGLEEIEAIPSNSVTIDKVWEPKLVEGTQ